MKLFGKNKDIEVENKLQDKMQELNMEDAKCSFTYSVYDRFKLKDTTNTMVIGFVTGTIKKGCEVYVTNPGDDQDKIIITQVLGLEVGNGQGEYSQVQELKDGMVAVMLKDCADEKIKPGTVLYSKESSDEAIHSAYVKGIGDSYIQHKDMQLGVNDFPQMSITDLAECTRLYNYVLSMSQNLTEEQAKVAYDKLTAVGDVMVRKLLDMDHVNIVYNKETNEPHMFSRTYQKGEGYECTPPAIMMVTDAYLDDFVDKFEKSVFFIRRINNGAEKKGIYNYLGEAFYVNGAQGLAFAFDTAVVSAERIVPKPKYEGMREVDIPVTNPDLKRWMLLLGQIGKPEGEQQEVLYKLYYRFMAMEMVKARFLVPMKIDDSASEKAEKTEEGTMYLNKNTKIQIGTTEGKEGRSAVCMYTDWNLLRQTYDEEWGGAINTIDQMLEQFDIAINLTKFPAVGCYLTKDMYENMKNIK